MKLEDIHPADQNTEYPVCLAGKRACPPEDCGGCGGYYDLLETLENPEDPEYESIIEWLGEGYDPSEFKVEEVMFQTPEENFGVIDDLS